jgi:MFS family permease
MAVAPRARSELGPAGVAASFAARGLHSVLLPWLLLGAAPAASAIGGVQGAALGAQAVALAALGGLGDRWGARRVAVAGQLAASLPALALAAAGSAPPLAAIAAYALASGAVWGFVSPARDALVADGGERDLLRPTAGFAIAQFAGLLAGIALASRAEGLGARTLLAAQGALHLAAAAALARGGRLGSVPARETRKRPAARLAGDARSAPFGDLPALEMIGLSALFGLCSAGPFAVWAPLFAAEAGGPSASALALLFALFPIGTIAGSLALRRVALPCDKRGAMLASHAAASLCLGAAGLTSSFGAAAVSFALWGFCGGVFMTCGRARLLESRPPGEHARLLSALQLALLVASTAGAALAGLVANRIGARPSLAVFAVLSLAGVVAAARAPRVRLLGERARSAARAVRAGRSGGR